MSEARPQGVDFGGYSRLADARVRRGDWALRLLGPAVWSASALMLMAMVSGCFCLLPTGVGVLLGPPATFLIVSFAWSIARSYEERRSLLALGFLEHAVRMNLPLGPMLRGAAASERWVSRWRLRQLAGNLEAGMPVAAAVEASLPELPKRVVGLIKSGEGNGNLGEVLARISEEQTKRVEDSEPERVAMREAYGFGVLIALGMIVTSVLIFVVPKFREIFKDFRTEMPWLTEMLLGLSDWVANSFGWVLLVPVFIGVVIFLGVRVRQVVAPWWPGVGVCGAMEQWFGRELEYVPLVSAVRRDGDWADACRVLADGLRQGREMAPLLWQAREVVRTYGARRSLENWAKRVEAGEEVTAAAERAGVPSAVVGMMRTISRAGGGNRDEMAKMMVYLATHYAMKFSRAQIVMRAMIEPAMTLVLAVFVGTTVVALFLPLVKLINSVSGGGDLL